MFPSAAFSPPVSQRISFIRSLHIALEQGAYLLLKSTGLSPELEGGNSDLDIWIPEERATAILDFCSGFSGLRRFQIQKMPSVWWIHLYFGDGSYLQLDLLFRFQRGTLLYLSTETCLPSAICTSGWRTYSPPFLLEHALLFYQLNHSGLPAKYVIWWNGLDQSTRLTCTAYISRKYDVPIAPEHNWQQFDPFLRQQMLKKIRSMPGNGLLKRAARSLEWQWSSLWQKPHRKGLVVSFSGIDGAGKSTVLEQFRQLLQNKYRRKVVVLRHRPGLLPMLNAWRVGKQEAEAQAALRLPRQGSVKKGIGAYLRFAYYWCDYFLGQSWVWWRFQRKGYVVLYDRYYFDLIIDGKRSNIPIGEKLPGLLRPMIRMPDLNVFLWADPAVILSRKQELSEYEISGLTARYIRLFNALLQSNPVQYLLLENMDLKKTMRLIEDRYASCID